jgi:glycine oxidase
VIAGAGIIGLSAALDLRRHGLRVVVVERGRAMAEASWAAAGMLAANDPENPVALRPLSALSLRLYPGFLEQIERFSGFHIAIRTRVALQGTRSGHRFSAAEAEEGRRLNAAEIEDFAPGLAPGDRDFLLLEEMSLDPRDLCGAMPSAVREAGATVAEETAVLSVRIDGSGLEVETSRGSISAGAFLNCCGAWAGQLAARGGDRASVENLRLEPRKGQIVTVRLPHSEELRTVVRTPETYLVPRGDGRVVLGATVERAGFDKAVHAEVVRTLVEEAAALWPPIGRAQIVDSWAGLRPGSGDGLPALGRCGDPGCWLATGHFRNGILLAPATAHVVSQLIRGKEPDVDLSPFACDRLAAIA